MVVVSVLMTFLGALAVLLRVISRCMIVRRLGADDLMMLVGMILTFGYLFEILYGLQFGIGLHTYDDSIPNMIELLRIIYAIQLTYNTVIAAIKISIVCFYLRLAAVDSSFRLASWATIIFLALFYISTQTASLVQCLPIHGNWDLTGETGTKCFNKELYFYVIAVINILVDIWILVIPYNTLKGIKRPKRDKIVLLVIFGIGAFSCISSMIRLYTIKVFATSDDPFYDGVPINIWSMIEINVAIICASVPAMRPLFLKIIRGRVTNSNNSPQPSSSRYGHRMIPLSGTNRQPQSSYNAQVPSEHQLGSEENIIEHKEEVIAYEREFRVEESDVGTHSEDAGEQQRHA